MPNIPAWNCVELEPFIIIKIKKGVSWDLTCLFSHFEDCLASHFLYLLDILVSFSQCLFPHSYSAIIVWNEFSLLLSLLLLKLFYKLFGLISSSFLVLFLYFGWRILWPSSLSKILSWVIILLLQVFLD